MPDPDIALPDIQDREDIERLVNRFYDQVKLDDLLGPIFNDIAKVEWDHHLPRLYAFWQSVLFGDGGFRGNPLGIHMKLMAMTPMDWPRFERWLELFRATVDELFTGDNALRIKRAADDMAHVIYARINQVQDTFLTPRLTSRPMGHLVE